MSRLGKKPIVVPEKIKVEFKDGVLEVSGANGKLSQVINKKINPKIENGSITLERVDDSKE
jgi:large subunit ribosomal protein L6